MGTFLDLASGLSEFIDYFARNGLALDFLFASSVNRPNALLETLGGQNVATKKLVVHGKTALTKLGDGGFHGNGVAETGWGKKLRASFDKRNAGDGEFFQQVGFAESRMFEQSVGASIEEFEIAREIDNAEWIAIAPLDMNGSFVNQHGEEVGPKLFWLF